MLQGGFHPLGSASNQGEQGWMLLVGTPMGSAPMAGLVIRSQADPSPALGISLVQRHSQTLVVRSTGCSWLFGGESQLLSGSSMLREPTVPLTPFVMRDLTQSPLQCKTCLLKAHCQQNTTAQGGVGEWANLRSPVTSQW